MCPPCPAALTAPSSNATTVPSTPTAPSAMFASHEASVRANTSTDSSNVQFIMTSSTLSSKLFWLEFLELYKENSCLWDFHSSTYMRRDLRNAAYSVLLEKYREIEPSATHDMVKKKIDVFRTGYRRELRKIKESKNSAVDEEYKPTLWYFDQLKFLDFQGVCEVKSNESEDQAVEYIDIPAEYTDPVVKYRLKKRKLDRKPRPRPRPKPSERERPITPVSEPHHVSLSYDSEEDDCATYCASLKLQMRDLGTQQKFIAQKLISDVIFLARTSQLTLDSSILIASTDNF